MVVGMMSMWAMGWNTENGTWQNENDQVKKKKEREEEPFSCETPPSVLATTGALELEGMTASEEAADAELLELDAAVDKKLEDELELEEATVATCWLEAEEKEKVKSKSMLTAGGRGAGLATESCSNTSSSGD